MTALAVKTREKKEKKKGSGKREKLNLCPGEKKKGQDHPFRGSTKE